MAKKTVRRGFVSMETRDKLAKFFETFDDLQKFGILCETYLYEKHEEEFCELSDEMLKVSLATEEDNFFSEEAAIPIQFIKKEYIEDDENFINIILGMDCILKQK
jgi:hypothetical protein